MAKFKNHDIIKENRSCDLRNGLITLTNGKIIVFFTLFLTF